MRILIVSKTLTFHRNGGFETHVTGLATKLAERGHDVHVVCRPIKKHTDSNFKIHEANYIGVDIDAVDNLTSVPFFVKKIKSLGRFDIVHGHGVSAISYPLSKGQAPFVYTLHGLGEKNIAGYNKFLIPILKMSFDVQKFCLTAADKVICQSMSMLKEGPEYYKFDRGKCLYIPSALDIRKFLQKRNDGKHMIGYVGFLHERKGLHFLLHAMKKVAGEMPDAKLVVAGHGNVYRFKTMSKRLGIEKNVMFLQNASEKEIIRLYNSLDVFCLPSQYESFGLAAYEAVASGTPVVLSKTADFEQLASGNGFSVEASDVPAISEKIITILKDGKLRNGFSAKCYKKIKPFDWMPVVKQTEALYESLAR